MKKAVYFFCVDAQLDPAAVSIMAAAENMYDLKDNGQVFDGFPIRSYTDASGNTFLFVRTLEVLSHVYCSRLDQLNALFSGFDFAGVVNWHAGAKAPEMILTVHSIGDVPSGYYSPSDPVLYRNMLMALDKAIEEHHLEGWTACTEATHWSGMLYDNDPARLPEWPVPQYDIEIGSSPVCWTDPRAAAALASALVHVFDDDVRPKTVLACGGVHFESAFSVCGIQDEYPVMCAHILPNQWMVSGDYTGEEGLRKLKAAAAAIPGGIDAISFHDNLASPYKDVCRKLAAELGIPIFKHRTLRDPAKIRAAMGE